MSDIISKIQTPDNIVHHFSPSTCFVCGEYTLNGSSVYYNLWPWQDDQLTDIRISEGTTIWVNFRGSDFRNSINNVYYFGSVTSTYFTFSNGSGLPIYLNSATSPVAEVPVFKMADETIAMGLSLNTEVLDGKMLSFTYHGDYFYLNSPSSSQIIYATCNNYAGTENINLNILPTTINSLSVNNGTQLYVKFNNDSMNGSAPLADSSSNNEHYLKLTVFYEGTPHPIVYDGRVIGTYDGLLSFGSTPFINSYYSTGIYSGRNQYWTAGDIVHFIYLDNAWHILEILNSGKSSKNGTAYLICTSSASTTNKIVENSNFHMRDNGTVISVYFTAANTNSSQLLLTVNGTSNRILGPGNSSTNIFWDAYTLITFIYEDTGGGLGYWHIISKDKVKTSSTTLSSSNLTSTGSTSGTTAYCLDLSSVLTNVSIS